MFHVITSWLPLFLMVAVVSYSLRRQRKDKRAYLVRLLQNDMSRELALRGRLPKQPRYVWRVKIKSREYHISATDQAAVNYALKEQQKTDSLIHMRLVDEPIATIIGPMLYLVEDSLVQPTTVEMKWANEPIDF